MCTFQLARTAFFLNKCRAFLEKNATFQKEKCRFFLRLLLVLLKKSPWRNWAKNWNYINKTFRWKDKFFWKNVWKMLVKTTRKITTRDFTQMFVIQGFWCFSFWCFYFFFSFLPFFYAFCFWGKKNKKKKKRKKPSSTGLLLINWFFTRSTSLAPFFLPEWATAAIYCKIFLAAFFCSKKQNS